MTNTGWYAIKPNKTKRKPTHSVSIGSGKKVCLWETAFFSFNDGVGWRTSCIYDWKSFPDLMTTCLRLTHLIYPLVTIFSGGDWSFKSLNVGHQQLTNWNTLLVMKSQQYQWQWFGKHWTSMWSFRSLWVKVTN